MLNHHFATRAPNHCDPRALRARALCSAYPKRRSGDDRQAPKTKRKVLGNPECSSLVSRYRIPQRSRPITANERFLFARSVGLPHCACSIRRAASRESSSGRRSGFCLEPDRAGTAGVLGLS